MQPVFAANVELAPAERGADAPSLIQAWTKKRFGVPVEPWQAGARTALNRPQGHLESMLWESGDQRLWRLDVRHADDSDDTLAWTTSVWLGQEGASSWLRVRVDVTSVIEGRIAEPVVKVGSPGVLRDCVVQGLTRVDGIDLGTVRDVTPENVAHFVAFLTRRDRRLPVVLISAGRDGTVHVDAERLLKRLAGVAHVASIEPAATFLLSDALTPRRSCFDGAVRLYWPGFTPMSDPYRHPLFLRQRIETLGVDQFVDDLVLRVGRVAATALGTPALERSLRREAAAARDGARFAALEASVEKLRLEATGSAGAVEGGLTAEEFAQFSDELRELEIRAGLAEERAFELEVELETERAARARAEEQASLAWQAMARQEPANEATDPIEDVAPPRTVREAVDQAATRVTSIVITDSALKAADESHYPQPSRVLDDLLQLDDVCRAWAEGRLPAGGFRVAFSESFGGAFRTGISDTAKTTYRSDYEVEFEGETLLMGPHIARGVGQPSQILRIYWYPDETGRRFIVGHVGRKLRDGSNRN